MNYLLFARRFAILSLISFATFSQVVNARGISISNVPEEEETSPWTFGVSASAGYGVFQDIQVPVNVAAGSRGDGTTSAQENQSHTGIPISGGLSLSYQVDAVIYDAAVEFLDMQSVSGPTDTQSSSYSRLALSSGLKVLAPFSGINAVYGARLIGQRSSFNNVTSGHYIEALLIQGSFGFDAEEAWMIEGFYSLAPYAQFGYRNGSEREKFTASSATLNIFGVDSSLNIHEDTWFDLGVNVETAQIKIQDVEEYNTYGLSVTPTPQSSRLYNMATMILKVGFHKTF